MSWTQWIRRLRHERPARAAGGAAAVLALVAAVVVVAPGWWADVAVAVGGWLRAWWLVLLLLAVAGGLAVWLGWPRRWMAALRRPRAEGAALPLVVHVTVLLTVAVAVTVLTGLLLWLALGRPDLAAGTPAPTSTTTPMPKAGWSAQNTFDGLRAVLSVVAGIGAVVALTVAYRRQHHHEAAEQREDTKLYNERFAKAVELLGSDQAAVRLGGVYAMAGLADGWIDGRQTCIDVLCAYLRMPDLAPTALPTAEPASAEPATQKAVRDPREEQQVRHTIIRLIRDHLRPAAGTGVRWHGHHFDLTGTVLNGGDLSGIDVPDGTAIDLSGAQFSGGTVYFSGAQFSGGIVDFAGAAFSGGTVNFADAAFSGGMVAFAGAAFSGGTVYFADAAFSGGTVHFGGTAFSGGTVHFTDAAFSGGTVYFAGAAFSGGTVNFFGARFSDGTVYFGGAAFSDGTVDFFGAEFSGGTVDFGGAAFSGGTVDFSDAEFSGGVVDFQKPRIWTRPPIVIDGSEPGVRWTILDSPTRPDPGSPG